MEIDVQLTSAPIAEQLPPESGSGIGAWAEFRGLVRGEENGQPIAALEYEAYSPMAGQEMRRILGDLAARYPCVSARVIHRIGIVPVGEAAIYIGVAGRHRAEAFALLGEFMDRLKQDVPIWKTRALAVVPPASEPVGARDSKAASASHVLRLLGDLCPPLGTERVCLANAGGRILRERVTAPEDQPAFDRSSVDGYAVRLDDSATRFQMVDEIRAGEWKRRALQRGETVRIATGGALPCDDLQVVMKEEVRLEGRTVIVLRRDRERNIRFCGEDARAGQELVAEGTALLPGTLGLLASVGCAQPLVTRLPRVLHVATGNELVAPETPPGHGQIRDSNSTLVRAFLGQWGILPAQERVGEDEAAIEAVVAGQTRELDLLLVSGGASVGEHDFTRRLLERAGFTIHVHRTTARPGKPLIVAERGGTVAFGLPGNPLAHFVCLNLYVRAALEAWLGQGATTAFQKGVLAEELAAGGNARETFWPARWELVDGRVWLTPLRWSSSGDLTALATANALLRVAIGARQFSRGSQVDFIRTSR
jgi:molybdopterin molybdotransferase